LMNADITFDEWLCLGTKLNFCTPQFCQTHDYGPTTRAEEAAVERGADPCVHVVRLGCPDDWNMGVRWTTEYPDESPSMEACA